MTSIPEYDRGFRDGIRAAVTWLHRRAEEMNDPHAKGLYNTAAFNLGTDFSAEVQSATAIRAAREGK